MPRGIGLYNAPFVRAFRTAPSGIAALAVLCVLAFFAAFASRWFQESASAFDFGHPSENPTWSHLLGTDALGRDILARLLIATRSSLAIALAAVGIGFAIGVPFGATVALVGRGPRLVMQRFIDALLAFPVLLTALFVGAILGPGTTGAIIGVGIALSFPFSRITSTLALSVGGREYVNAARVIGAGRLRLLFRYVLPNIAESLIIALTVSIAVSIVAVSALSFLGLGVQPPDADWGRMLTDGVRQIYLTPAAALGPAGAIAITAIAWGFFGEAAARAMNPLLWTAPSRKTTARLAGGDETVVASAEAATAPAMHPTNGDRGGQPELDGAILRVSDLAVTFPAPTGPADIVKGVSFTIGAGELLGIVGESGSGKTMTALAVAQLVSYPGEVSGTISLHGQNLRELPPARLNRFLGTDLAVVFQDPMSSLNPALKVGTQLIEAAQVHRRLGRRTAQELAVARLREVHFAAPDQQLARYPHEFSGGMRQRAMIAMGLMNEPSLLIADEPTTALDVTIQAQIMDLLNEVNQTHKTAVILISHNLALISQNCHRVIVMYAGRIVEELNARDLTTDPLHPYTRALLGAVPELGRSRDIPLEYIPGEAPDITSPPSGCPFHPRCPLAIAKCSTDRPPLLSRPGRRRVACWVANDDIE